MQLLEVKNDIAKIIYNPAENHLLPFDFLLIEDVNQKLIAQIINISTTENSDNNLADVRLALYIDKDDNLSYYNGYIPSKTSNVIYINPDEIIELLKGRDENIYFGNLSNHSKSFAKLSLSFINDRVYIQSDREDKTKIAVQNIISELYNAHKKVILLDFDGRYCSVSDVARVKISESFKLPLNIEAFNNILEYDTVDCPLEDKAVIQSIVLELREYIKTVENKFLPFTLFKNVIDNEFMANPVSGLMLLRNKLWLYAQENIFAEAKSQFDFINSILDNQDMLIIDASSLEEKWYKFAISTILSLVNKHCYFVLSLNDIPLDKKSVINLYNKSDIIPIVSTTYDSKYRQILKSICKNQILFKPSNLFEDEEPYNVLLNKINSGEFILYGESTLYLSLLLELQAFNSSTSDEVIQNEIRKDVDKLLSSPKPILTIEPEEIIENPAETNLDKLDELFDEDFNDSDFDFLDQQNQEQITIEDLKTKNDLTDEKDEKYDVFTPLSEDEINSSCEVEDIVEDKPLQNDEIVKPVEEENAEKNSEDIDIILNNILPMGAVPINENSKIKQTEETPQKISEEPIAEILKDTAPEVLEETVQEISEKTVPDIMKDTVPEVLEETVQEVSEETVPEIMKDTVQEISEEAVAEISEETVPEIPEETKIQDDKINELNIKEETPADVENSDENPKMPETVEEENTVIDDIINDIAINRMTQEKQNEDNSESDKEESSFEIELETDSDTVNEPEIEPPPINNNIKTKTSPDLTIYEAETSSEVSMAEIPFKVGDKVYQPKYGSGIVVGFTNYSNRILFCQIEFENFGKRILDPRVTMLEKIS